MRRNMFVAVMISCGVIFVPLASHALPNNSGCYYGNTITEFLRGDTYMGDLLLNRNASGKFEPIKPILKELTAYLDNLNLPNVVAKAHIILRKSLVYYNPMNTAHYGKPWYDHEGQLTNLHGDENLLRTWSEINYKAVRVKMLDWEIQYHWGPYIFYENERDGKNIVDIKVELLHKNNCWLGKLEFPYYHIPEVTTPINLDNIDGGNEFWQVVLYSCGANPYVSIDGGTAPLYPDRKKELRWEWNAIRDKKFTSGHANNTSQHSEVKIAGKAIIYNTTVVYPHMTEPKISVMYDDERGGQHLIVELPKYFHGRFIPAFVSIECVDDSTVNVRMIRGSLEQIFFTPISKDPAKKPSKK